MANHQIVGYTCGVYDLFHIGHLNILKRAREQCDRLIVGVSVDELVMEYKHHRPIVPYSERVEIVKAVRYVDEVVPQTSMDKLEAWNRLHFDVMFHGDDWRGSSLYNAAEKALSAIGVRIVYFPYTNGTSSTALTEALRKLREGAT